MAFPVAAGTRITTAVINHAYTIADANVTTLTAAAYNDLSSVYQIPADDAAVGMAYELTAFGNGTTGTAETMQFGLNLGGSIVGVAPTIGSSALGNGLAFRWRMSLILIPASTGSTGTWVGSIEGTVAYSGGNDDPGSSANFTVPIAGGNSSVYTQDTTVASDFSLWFQWGGTTGTPTITCIGTRFTRCG